MKVRKFLIGIIIVMVFGLVFYLLNVRKDGISIEPLKTYAKNCMPCEEEMKSNALRDSGLVCYKPPIPPEEVLTVLSKRKIDEDYEKWVLLVYLKLYEKQLILYKQSFEVRNSPYLVKRFNNESEFSKAFCEVIGENAYEKKLGPEFLPASKAYEFIDEHQLFVNDADIQLEMRLIKDLLSKQEN
jgi:hypothetical protein